MTIDNQLDTLRALRDATTDQVQRAALDVAIATLENQQRAILSMGSGNQL